MRKRFVLLTLLSLAGCIFAARGGEVKIWEGTITLPTYRVNPPEKAPFFSRDFAYQRAKRGVYPYAMDDNPTYDRVDSTHVALYLENDYIEMCVLPGIGGRLFYAIDKTNGYDIFYHQHVIKPANVGMLGAWISGGVEWNVFHHHRASSQLPVDYKLVENADGSKTIWVGEIEPRQRMSWAIGMTLHPDKSYIEITGRLINNTADRNSILYWSNVATHANKDYQIIFPENTDFGVYHAKNDFVRWPVSDAPYLGIDEYKKGIDVSWWKNLPASTSIFVNDLHDDFIGGYDHGRRAGTMLVGNHNINKGGKFWLWGPKAYGHMWECVSLTDDDGPYVELMTAAYSDNQPDYCWLNPYEVKEFTSYWYGIRDLNNVNRGNRFATVNMDIKPKGKLFLAANVTEVCPGARITVTGKDGKKLYETTADMAPDRPFAAEVAVAQGELADPAEVTMTLYSASGQELITYSPYRKDRTKPYPETVKPPRKPAEIESQEELYYTGMRNLQFHQAHVEPTDYFLEALRRDPGDVRCNTQMGIYYRMRGDYAKAAQYLRRSLVRQTHDYTRPSDAEAMYNMGLVLKAGGKYADAADTLYRSAWDYAYASPSYYQLAQISALGGDMAAAKQQADMAIRYNGMNFEAKNLLSTILRHEGDTAGAEALAGEVLSMDPLNFYATHEMTLMGKKPAAELRTLLRDNPESYIEMALYYRHNGADKEARMLLETADAIKPYPTVKYYLGWMADLEGDKAAAAKYFRDAENMSTDWCFPFRLETVTVYEKALEYNPRSAVTYYYLGNLLFDKQPAAAMEAWTGCLAINKEYAMAQRNMGWGHRFFTEDLAKAIAYYEDAVRYDKTGSALYLAELDELYEMTNAPLLKRYEMLTGHHDRAIKRYDSMVRQVRMMILQGEFDQALDILLNNFFSRREGIEDLHDIYVDACLLAGLRAMDGDDAARAVKYFLLADEYPEMHFYARVEYYARNSQIYYLTGLAYEKAGNKSLARKFYKMAADNAVRNSDFNYEKSLAMLKLDPKADVKPVYEALVEKGKGDVTDYVERFFVSFGHGEYPESVNSRAYYTIGLGYMALGDKARAGEYFNKALGERNDNVWANYYLGNIK